MRIESGSARLTAPLQRPPEGRHARMADTAAKSRLRSNSLSLFVLWGSDYISRRAEHEAAGATALAEYWIDDQVRVPDYWQIVRVSSSIALPVHGKISLFPSPDFHPGINQPTLNIQGVR